MSAEPQSHSKYKGSVFAGRIDILYSLGRHYLSLPFAALCVSATLFGGAPPTMLPFMPLALLIVVAIAAEQAIQAYKHRASGSDPHFWAQRYTFVSAIAGASWGVGVVLLVRPRFISGRSVSLPRLHGHDGDGIHRTFCVPSGLSGACLLLAWSIGHHAADRRRRLSRYDGRAGGVLRRRALELLHRHGAAAGRKHPLEIRKYRPRRAFADGEDRCGGCPRRRRGERTREILLRRQHQP